MGRGVSLTSSTRVNSWDSHPPLGYCGLRRDLFLRCKCTSFLVKQERRWLCQPAVTPITTIRGGTRRYFLSNVLGTVHICVRYRPAVVAHVQPAFNTVRVTCATTTRTRRRLCSRVRVNRLLRSGRRAKTSYEVTLNLHEPPVPYPKTSKMNQGDLVSSDSTMYTARTALHRHQATSYVFS